MIVHLFNAQQGHAALARMWHEAKALLISGQQLEVHMRKRRRSLPQNAKLHACIAEIAEKMQWAGRRREVEDWKRLLTAAWLRARGTAVEIVPALDGHGFDVLYRHTSRLTAEECSELLEYVMAWGAENGIDFEKE